MSEERTNQLAKLRFVAKMGVLSEKTFKEVYDSNQDFVDFTRASMRSGKGVFKFWIEYCKLRSNA